MNQNVKFAVYKLYIFDIKLFISQVNYDWKHLNPKQMKDPQTLRIILRDNSDVEKFKFLKYGFSWNY